MRTLITLIVLFLGAISLSYERDFSTPERSLMAMFPGAKVIVKNVIISKEQKRRIEKMARSRIDSRLISVYLVRKDGRVIAYGYVDVHRVRTHPESVLFVISPEGKIIAVEVLSFNEPLEYMADESWLALFKGKSLDKDPLRVNRDIPNMTGATLTARAITRASRRALAIWKVLFGGER
ncbi:MAG: FMN-binding protein [Aquificota bacterium]|nr:FMN-binding protein [Aquificota bacterium]